MEKTKENINDLLMFYIKNNDYEVLLEKCKTLIKNPFILFDSTFTVLIASDENVKNRKEIKKYGSNYVLSLLDENDSYESIIEDLKDKEKVQYKEYPFMDVPVLIKRIGDNTNVLGYFVIYLKEKSHKKTDSEYAEMLSIVINHEFTLRRLEEKNEKTICINILDGKYSGEQIKNLLKNITIRNIKKGNKKLAIIRLEKNKHNIIHIMNKNNLTAFLYKGDVVSINNSSDTINNDLLYEIVEQYKTEKIKIGISGEFNNLSELPTAYNQANETLNIGNIFYPKKSINAYDDYLLISTVKNLPNNVKEKIIDDRINKVIEYDNSHNSNFYQEIKTYFECGRNINKTAKALFQHKNSVYYHIEKIKEIFDIDLESEEDCFSCELSVKIIEIIARLE